MDPADFEYLAFGPTNGPATALVVVLHGYGRSAFYMQKTADAIRARLPGTVVICPHAPQPMDFSAMADTRNQLHLPQDITNAENTPEPEMQRQWFPIDGGPAALVPRLESVSVRLNTFIDLQRTLLGLPDSAVALVGFSQGAGTALYTACRRAGELACVIVHSSIVIHQALDESKLRSRPHTLFLYGDADPEFPQDAYARSFDWVHHHMAAKATRIIIPGLGHYTSTRSRTVCADYLHRIFTPA